jgi:hypothetical protein
MLGGSGSICLLMERTITQWVHVDLIGEMAKARRRPDRSWLSHMGAGDSDVDPQRSTDTAEVMVGRVQGEIVLVSGGSRSKLQAVKLAETASLAYPPLRVDGVSPNDTS